MINLSAYHYDLSADRIAQAPAFPRDSSRLMILHRKDGTIKHDFFYNLDAYLNQEDLLVVNNTRVMPARIFGQKKSGGKVELLLLHELKNNLWECLVRPGRRLPVGTEIFLNGGKIKAILVDRLSNGERLVKFSNLDNIRLKLEELGEIPFPPYVRNPECEPEQYQTIYSEAPGAVAAPTAGLHFTHKLFNRLQAQGISQVKVTLHVGWGTFRPVRSESITDHVMEKEWYSISKESAKVLSQALQRKKRIVAVGTTTCRVLESLPKDQITAKEGWTQLFIYPGFQFQWVDKLITNFHLPRSTLLMLVSAFAGRENIMQAYDEAIRTGYRFYSFGDAMLIL